MTDKDVVAPTGDEFCMQLLQFIYAGDFAAIRSRVKMFCPLTTDARRQVLRAACGAGNLDVFMYIRDIVWTNGIGRCIGADCLEIVLLRGHFAIADELLDFVTNDGLSTTVQRAIGRLDGWLMRQVHILRWMVTHVDGTHAHLLIMPGIIGAFKLTSLKENRDQEARLMCDACIERTIHDQSYPSVFRHAIWELVINTPSEEILYACEEMRLDATRMLYIAVCADTSGDAHGVIVARMFQRFPEAVCTASDGLYDSLQYALVNRHYRMVVHLFKQGTVVLYGHHRLAMATSSFARNLVEHLQHTNL
jgi:hypothetical protein